MKTKFIYRGLTIRLSRRWFGWRAEIDWPSAVQVIDTVESAKHVLKCAKDQIKLSFKIAKKISESENDLSSSSAFKE